MRGSPTSARDSIAGASYSMSVLLRLRPRPDQRFDDGDAGLDLGGLVLHRHTLVAAEWSPAPPVTCAFTRRQARRSVPPVTTYARVDGVLHDMLDDRAVLVTADGKEVVTLNPVGSLVWQALQEPADVDALADALAGHFPDVDGAVLHRDVEAFVGSLLQAGLITTRDR